MREKYKDYIVNIEWSNESLGYIFQIYREDGAEILSSIDPYMYMENALIGARESIDSMK